MQEEEFEKEIKVLVVGNGGVGKTSMIRRFCKGTYTDEYKKTIGVDFLEKVQFVNSLHEEVRMMVWDTAGQEEFDALTRGYYRGAGAAVIAFSTTDRASFDAVATWKAKVAAECGDIAMCLVQNKVDLLDKAVVTPEEAEGTSRQLGLRFYRTCVKENLNVQEELHSKKLAKGKIQAAPAAQPIAHMNAQGNSPAAAPPSPTPRTEPSRTIQQQLPEPDQHEMDGNHPVPKTIDLQPTKRRTGGKKTLIQKMGCNWG